MAKTKKNNNNNNKYIKKLLGTHEEDHAHQSPSCRIVAKGSRIGTLGDTQLTQTSIGADIIEGQPPSCRIVAYDSRIGAIGGGEGGGNIISLGDTQLLSRHSGLDGENGRTMLGNYNSSSENRIINSDTNNNNLNTDHNNNSVAGNNQFPSRCNPDLSDQLSRFNHSNNSVAGNNQFPSRYNSDQ